MSALDFSDNEDDPDVYESSGSEWNSSSDLEPKKRTGRKSARATKKQRLKSDSTSSDSEIEDSKPRTKNGVNKKQKLDKPSPSSPIKKRTSTKVVNLKEFSTGSFLINKKDVQVGDRNKHPCIWRVDGKSLLQKYEAFDDEGTIRHRATSVYTGWSPLDRDMYAPVTVTVRKLNNQTMIVDLNWEKLKEINMDSD